MPRIAPLRILRTWAGINTTVDGKGVLGPVGEFPGSTRNTRGRRLYARAAFGADRRRPDARPPSNGRRLRFFAGPFRQGRLKRQTARAPVILVEASSVSASTRVRMSSGVIPRARAAHVQRRDGLAPAVANRNRERTQTDFQLLVHDRPAFQPDLADHAAQLHLGGDRIRRESRQRHLVQVLVQDVVWQRGEQRRPVETQCAGTRLPMVMPTLTRQLDVARAT